MEFQNRSERKRLNKELKVKNHDATYEHDILSTLIERRGIIFCAFFEAKAINRWVI